MPTKYILLFFLTATLVAALFFNSSAAQPWQRPSDSGINLPASPIDEPDKLVDVIAKIVGIAWKVFFIIAVLFILVAAFNYLTAHGNEETIKKAHQQLTYAAIAIVIALLSVSADEIIQNFLEGQSGGSGGPFPQRGYPSTPTTDI